MSMPRDEATKSNASHPLNTYLHEINEFSLLTAEDERRLARGINDGDEAALAGIISANLRLVVRVARDYQNRGLPMDDLIGEGNIGLIRAAKDFDPQFGVRFSTYAGYWIRQAIREALINTTPTIRIPHHMVRIQTNWRRAEASLAGELGRSPDFDEVADRLGLSDLQKSLVAKAKRAKSIRTEGASIDEGDYWSPDDSVDQKPDSIAELEDWDERAELVRRLEVLDGRERMVLSHHYGLDGAEKLTLAEIAARLGFTREWVRRIELRALVKLSAAGREATPV